MPNLQVFFRCFAALCLIAVFPAMSGAEVPMRQQVTVNYRCIPGSQRILISVMLNGKMPATLMVDTGMPASAVSETLAKKMGLVPQPYLLASGKPSTMMGQQLKKIDIVSLDMGEGKTQLSFGPYPLVVFSDKVIAAVTPIGVDGMIGADILRWMAVRLDCPRHQVTLWYPGNLSPDEVASDGFDHAFVVPVSDPDQVALYWVQGQLQNGLSSDAERMMVDTGSDGTIISNRAANALKLTPDTTQKATLLSGSATLFRAKIPSVCFGDLILHDFPVYYYEKDNLQNPVSLGMDVLSGYRVLLDYAHGSMYLKPTVPDHINILSK